MLPLVNWSIHAQYLIPRVINSPPGPIYKIQSRRAFPCAAGLNKFEVFGLR